MCLTFASQQQTIDIWAKFYKFYFVLGFQREHGVKVLKE